MKKAILLLLLLIGILPLSSETSRPVVYKVDIQEEIGAPVWRSVKRSFDEAERLGASYILIHMNTYGGTVIHADSLRSLILGCRVPVWVFIDNNAASAGALIAIACDRIYMRSGANIGAATVVNQTGEAMPDKYQSYMRSMIRSTAESQGRDTVRNEDGSFTVKWRRDPRIAEAMVDESLVVEGVSDSGKVLTFTPGEAMQWGFCDGIAASVAGVIEQEGLTDYELKTYEYTPLDRVIGFLLHPMVQGILIMLIVGGLYFELQTPGVGFPLVAALTGCALYFAPLYLEGLASHAEMILFAVGIILLLLELFVIPGFGVAGISGIICIVVALALAGVDIGSFRFMGDIVQPLVKSLFFVTSCSVIALVGSIWLSRRLFGSRKLALALYTEEAAEEGFVGVDMAPRDEVGREGVVYTDLRPGGKVRIDKEIYDAISAQGGFITAGSPVKVVQYKAGQVYVEPV